MGNPYRGLDLRMLLTGRRDEADSAAWRPYGLRSVETHPWRPVRDTEKGCASEPGLRESVRNDGAVACFRPRIMSPSNHPDFYVVTSHRRSNHVNSPATRPMISHRLSPCSDFGVTDASEVEKMLNLLDECV